MAGTGFTPEGARRVAEVTRYIEGQAKGQAIGPRGTGPRGRRGLIPAGTGSSIAAGASGTVTLKVANATTGALTAGSVTVTAINPTGSAVAASKLVWLEWYAGWWYVVNEACS